MLFRNWALNDYNKSGCVVINKDVFCWFMFIKVYTLPSVRISLFSMAFLYTDNRFPHASKISLNFLLNSGNYHLCTNFLQYMSKFFFLYNLFHCNRRPWWTYTSPLHPTGLAVWTLWDGRSPRPAKQILKIHPQSFLPRKEKEAAKRR